MHRGMVLEQIRAYNREELVAWREHVLRCLAYHEKDQNDYEVDECQFLLKHLNERLAQL